jgi:hypothetical protein
MTTNTTSSNEFALRIKTLLSASSAAWREIASVLCNAEEQFGYHSKQFNILLKDVAFSKATATKLIKIARDKRIAANAALFDTCSAWTVLYEITTLDAAQFERLVDLVVNLDLDFSGEDKGNKVLTVATVRAIKRGEEKKEGSPYRSAFTISIDVDALRTQEFDFRDYEELLGHIRSITNELKFIKVEKTELFEKQDDLYHNKMLKEFEVARYAHFVKAIKDCKINNLEWKSYRNKKKAGVDNLVFPPLGIYSDYMEAKDHFLEDPDAFFEAMGVEIPDPNVIAREANLAIERKNLRFLNRLRSRPETPTSEDIFDRLDEGDIDGTRKDIEELRTLTSFRARLKNYSNEKLAA